MRYPSLGYVSRPPHPKRAEYVCICVVLPLNLAPPECQLSIVPCIRGYVCVSVFAPPPPPRAEGRVDEFAVARDMYSIDYVTRAHGGASDLAAGAHARLSRSPISLYRPGCVRHAAVAAAVAATLPRVARTNARAMFGLNIIIIFTSTRSRASAYVTILHTCLRCVCVCVHVTGVLGRACVL